MFDIDVSKVCFIVAKAHAFDAQDEIVVEDSGSNPVDDGLRDVLESQSGDATVEELKDAIAQLNIDEQCQLVALAWIGRGDYTKDEWREALRIAAQRHTEHTAEYLIGMPLLGEYLEAGLDAFGFSCGD